METPVNSVNAYVLSSVSFSSGRYSLKNSSDDEVISFTVDGSFISGWIWRSDTLVAKAHYPFTGFRLCYELDSESGTMGAGHWRLAVADDKILHIYSPYFLKTVTGF